MVFPSYQEQLFHNFKVSVRGSIRKPPNAATWVPRPPNCLWISVDLPTISLCNPTSCLWISVDPTSSL